MKLTPQRYFKLSLVIPFVIPLASVVFGFNLISGVLVMSLFYGGLPYIFFSVILFISISYLRTGRSIRILSFASPVLFIPFLAVFWLLPLYLVGQASPDGITPSTVLTIFATYIIIVGYLYVFIINIVFSLLLRKGMITEDATIRQDA